MLKIIKNSKNKRRDGDLNPGGLLTIGLAVRRRTRLGHPDIQIKKSYDKNQVLIQLLLFYNYLLYKLFLFKNQLF